MKNKSNIGFNLSKLFAIALIVLGFHFLNAYLKKELPFDIVTENTVIWIIWAYMGWGISGFVITAGAMEFFKEVIERWEADV